MIKTLENFFSFEGRCLVCGSKMPEGLHPNNHFHLEKHIKEGIVIKHKDNTFEQIKAHPVGFPGRDLPKELVWSK